MDQIHVVTYRFRDNLRQQDYRELTKKFTEVGDAPGVIAHYYRLDGRGGFTVLKSPEGDDAAKGLKVVMQYAPWIDFETAVCTTIEEAFPVIQSVYG